MNMTVKVSLWITCTAAALAAPGCALFQKVGATVDHWAEAEAAYSRKKYEEATTHYQAIEPDDPHYQAAQVGIGRCMWRQDKVNEAAQQMLGARRLDTTTFDGSDRAVRDLSLVYGAAAARSVAKASDSVVAIFPRPEGMLLLSDRGTLSAFDDKGATKWEAQLGTRHGGARAHVAFDGETAFAIVHDSKASEVVALDPATGRPKWTFGLGSGNSNANADAAAGTVYAPTRDGVVALNAADGTVRWTIETPERFGQLVAAGQAVCGESSKSLSCWSAASGEALGTYARPKRSDRGGLVSDGDKLYLVTDDALYAVGIAGGMTLAWKQLLGSRAAAPRLDAEHGVVAVTTTKQLLTFETSSGTPKTKADKPPNGSGARARLSPTRVDAGWLVSSGNIVYALDDSGAWSWIAGFEGTVTSAAVPAGSKSVLVAVSMRAGATPSVMDVVAQPW